jgi:hypothetical protein
MAGLNLSRNTRLFVSTIKDETNTSHSTDDTFEIRVLDGYNFSQDTNSQEVTLNEAGCTPVRGQRVFNTSLNPVDMSFDTYIRPYEYTNGTDFHSCVEYILWNALVSDTAITKAAAETTGEAMDSSDGYRLDIDFSDSNTHTLLPLYFFFVLDNAVYRINEVQLESAEIDFSIDSIAKITWSGMGLSIDEVTKATVDAWLSGTHYEAVPSGASFIKNKLSSMTIEDDSPAQIYNIPITGGSLTIANNIEYLTPEELAVVNFPIGSFTGTRSISGSVTAYLRTSTINDDETGDLYSNLISDTTTVTHSLDVNIKIGTCAAEDAGPFVELSMPQSHLVIPSINVEDIISTEISFTALGTDIDATDELVVSYINSGKGTAP